MNLLFGREIGIISIIFIIILSNVLLFYLQSITEAELRTSIFEQERQLQIQSTKEIAQHVSADIALIISMLYALANSNYAQEGQLGSEGMTKLLNDAYHTYNLTIDRLFILDKNDLMVSSVTAQTEFFLGEDFSFRNWIKETKDTHAPVFSGDFEREGIYREFITYPILRRESNEYIGTIVTSIPTVSFFAHYGNVNQVISKFLVAYDKKGIILANGANNALVGKDFFGTETQQFIKHNRVLNNLTTTLLAGKSGSSVYDYGTGERLTSGYPISVNSKPIFFIQIVTPTTQIYSKINNVLSIQTVKLFSIFIATSTVAIIVLILLLRKWNIILRKEVRKRTQELEESYDEMRRYLEDVLKEVRGKKQS